MADPRETRKNPAELVVNGVQTLGWSWVAQRINNGSKEPPPYGVAPKAKRCLSF